MLNKFQNFQIFKILNNALSVRACFKNANLANSDNPDDAILAF